MSRPFWTNTGIGVLVGNASIDAVTDELTIAGHGLVDGNPVVVDTFTGGAGDTLLEDTVYYVIDAATDTFRLAGIQGGNVKDFASAGTCNVYTATPVYPADELRHGFSGLLQRGDFSGGFAARAGVFPNASTANHVSVSGTTWTVNSLVAVVVHSTAGPYIVAFDGTSGSLDPADGTNDRIDGLDLQVRDDDEDASGFRDVRIVYVPGTPGAPPSPPAVTANSLRLSTILVPAGGTPGPSIDEGPEYTVTRGGVIPVEDDTAYPTTGGRYEGLMLWNSATNQLVANLNAGSTWGVVATEGAHGFIAQEVFTTSGTFEIGDYPGAQSVFVRVQAAGGGGGGCAAADPDGASAGGGGGGGQYREGRIDASALSASETVTVGLGGAGGPNGSSNGSPGGSSSFGAHISAQGGDNGDSDDTTGPGYSIHSGGSATSGGSGGDLTVEGGAGENGIHGNGIVVQQGNGGNAHLGNGGRAGSTNAGSNGPDAPGIGAGGSGGYDNSGGGVARSGGDGADGIVIVEVWG